MKHLQALLQGKCTSHILPFLWMKGEDNETIGKELDKIEKCGIREVCLESRPHPDFCGPKWWENLDFICAEAEKEGFVSGFWMTKSFQPDMLTADLKSTGKVKAVPWRATYGHYGSLPQRCSPGGKFYSFRWKTTGNSGSTKARWTDLGSKRKRHFGSYRYHGKRFCVL